jgi:anti-anti-sigma factor
MKRVLNSNGFSIRIESGKEGEITLSPSGRIETENLHSFLSEAEAILLEKAPRKLVVDLSEIEYLDSAGAFGLIQLEDRTKARAIPFQFINVTDEAKRIMALIDRKALTM